MELEGNKIPCETPHTRFASEVKVIIAAAAVVNLLVGIDLFFCRQINHEMNFKCKRRDQKLSVDVRKCPCIKMNLKRNLALAKADPDTPVRDVGRSHKQASSWAEVFRNCGVLTQQAG